MQSVYDTKPSARNQVRQFLKSEYSQNFKIDSYDVAILHTIANYIDMPNGVCYAKRSQLIIEARCCDRQFRDRVAQMIKHKILFKYFSKGKSHYLLGETLTGIILDI